jgi:hypothetical protein
MGPFEWLLIAWAAAFVINLVPYFMPPTWAVVAYFLIAYRLPVWPLAIGWRPPRADAGSIPSAPGGGAA